MDIKHITREEIESLGFEVEEKLIHEAALYHMIVNGSPALRLFHRKSKHKNDTFTLRSPSGTVWFRSMEVNDFEDFKYILSKIELYKAFRNDQLSSLG